MAQTWILTQPGEFAGDCLPARARAGDRPPAAPALRPRAAGGA